MQQISYPGDDALGSLWESPPADQANIRDTPPGDRPPFIGVLGSSGFRASWQTGITEVMEEVGDPVRLDLTSGGTIPGLALAAGINRHWRRIGNAGAPSHKVLRPLERPSWFENKNLDLAGLYDMHEMEKWLASWLAWAGVTTFRDLRYRPGELKPDKVAHRAGIGVAMWRTKEPYPTRCTDEQLKDPTFIRRAFRWAFFGRQFPWRRLKAVWVPDTIGDHLPWLKDEIEDHSPAFWARISMSLWPVCQLTVLQDPRTLHLVFLGDGGLIDNQPSLFNDGRLHPFPLLNPRLMQHKRQGTERQARTDARRLPFGAVVRFETTTATDVQLLTGPELTWERRDAMWRQGVEQGRERLPTVIAELTRRHAALTERYAESSVRLPVEKPVLHPFQALAVAGRPGTRASFGFWS
ncbi:hypothetical protein E1281_26880 [Actinomadura sp. KC345]|uniref:patatin-like phospholipase family protein n=1 Tax=Actinomadura sp. KC345 TaxID=2530371 RepID=UPI0010487075|nr:patatin-like phospholipase family protein [Actinomadura sp. KC345]TDC47023.1 hypothetical protein E1281_26880 [Actinomadura sp. KC345]